MKRNLKKIYWTVATLVIGLLPTTALAAPDALTAIDNLKNLMLSILSGAGVIMVIWGIVQVAMGFKSQDGTQKSHGILFLAGGALIASIGPVLTALGF